VGCHRLLPLPTISEATNSKQSILMLLARVGKLIIPRQEAMVNKKYTL
jgi:hypothetical protein